MDFRPLRGGDVTKLLEALRGNATHDRAILMDRRTGFVGTSNELTTANAVTDEEVISAIQSVPCHY